MYTQKGHLKDQNCKIRDCSFRRPRVCKWLKSKNGCQRKSDCDYLHDTLACEGLNLIDDSDLKVIDDYPCQGCKTSWTNKSYVSAHLIGETLFDEDGYLRRDV